MTKTIATCLLLCTALAGAKSPGPKPLPARHAGRA
jgi:hypothetical protein